MQRPLNVVLGTIAITVSVLFTSGCAIGNKHNLKDVVAAVPSVAGGRIVVATHDRRPYILTGEKPQNFVGLQRGGYGQPFDVTSEGDTFSNSFSAAACNSFHNAGTTCEVVSTTPRQDQVSILHNVLQRRPNRSLVFTVTEWKSDGMVKARMQYEVTLSVVDQAGTVLATQQVQGNDITSDTMWVLSPPRAARQGSLATLKAKLEELLGSPHVVAALTGARVANRGAATRQGKPPLPVTRAHSASPTSSGKASQPAQGACTSEQIIQMKKIGLTDQQVQSSCG